VDDVLNKYFEAVGGRASLEKLQSLSLSGTLTTRAGQSVPFTIEEKANKYREVRETKPTATVRAFDGAVGWMQSENRASNLTGFPLDEALRTNDLGIVLHLKDKYPALQASGRQIPVNGKAATVVTGREGVTTEQFYFDAASGLLVRRVITTRTPLGSLREQVDYGDYRAAGGVKIPFEIKRTTWNTLDTFKVGNAKANSSIDDSKFAKPRG
jgi:zinc protease